MNDIRKGKSKLWYNVFPSMEIGKEYEIPIESYFLELVLGNSPIPT